MEEYEEVREEHYDSLKVNGLFYSFRHIICISYRFYEHVKAIINLLQSPEPLAIYHPNLDAETRLSVESFPQKRHRGNIHYDHQKRSWPS